jgi:hypothetical protein
MHPDVIEAARDYGEELQEFGKENAIERARRVLAAQAKPEAISDGAARSAASAYLRATGSREERMRAALSAALLHMAKEGE